MKNEIAIIIRQTNGKKIQHLIEQLKRINVPAGLCVNVNIIDEAKSLAAAYNHGMNCSKAEYKIYIDEAVVVLNPMVLDWVLNIFREYPEVGLIGWYGSEIPIDGDISKAKSLYGNHCRLESDGTVTIRRGRNPIFYQRVEVVDGAVVATRGDVEWDETVGDYFALAAQCCRRKAIGQEVVVPMQNDNAVGQTERNPLYFLTEYEIPEYEVEKNIFYERYKLQFQPLVSVLIPTYNQPRFVTEALESVLAQDYENLEIVIGDDSTDKKTKDIMERYAKKYPNIRYFYHGGPLGEKGRNNTIFVLNHSHGEYVNYLLHDDLFMPTKISRMMTYYKQDLEGTIGLVTSSRYMINDQGIKIAEYVSPWLPAQDVIEDGETIGRQIISYYHNYIGEITTVLIRKKSMMLPVNGAGRIKERYQIGRFLGYVEKSMGDVSLWLEQARLGKRCVFIREQLSACRRHERQNSNDPEIIARCIRDWLVLAVISWVNGVFFRSPEEFRVALRLWNDKMVLSANYMERAELGTDSVRDFIKEAKSLIGSGRYEEACIGVIDAIKEIQPEGGVIIPDNYRDRCRSVGTDRAYFECAESLLKMSEKEESGLPLVSVIIPTYSRPHLFKIALDSVLAQTYKNLDIFITDNSKDEKTKELMAEYLEKDSRIKYEHHPEYNADDNWMRARMYDNPEAKYVNWLMDDDVWRPEKIEAMVKIMEEDSEVTIVTSYRRLIDERGELLPDLNTTKCVVDEDAKIDGEEAGGLLIKKTWNYIGEPTTALLRKSAMKNNQLGWTGHEGKYFVSDFPTWLRLLEKGKLVYLKKPYSYFRWHEDNGQKNLNWMLLSAVCWGLCIKHAWESKVFLKTFNDLKEAIGSWMSLTELTYKAIRIADCDETKKADYLAVRRAFNKALIRKGVLELNIDTGGQTG